MKTIKFFATTVALLLLGVFTAQAQHAALGGGSGTEADPYLIETAEHLAALATATNSGEGTSNKFYKLTADISLAAYSSGEGWMPIGTLSYNFRGHFDGNGKIISHLTINCPDADNSVGLFGYTYNATIQNLGVVECNIMGGEYYVGGIIGRCFNTTISNSYVTGVVEGEFYTGGLVGELNLSSSINNSYCHAEVIGSGNYVGGLVGYFSNSTINNSYSTGNIRGNDRFIGGLVGRNYYSKISNCFTAAESVVATSNAYGYVNRVAGYNQGTIHAYALSDMEIFHSETTLVSVTPNVNTQAGADATLAEFKSINFYTDANKWDTDEGTLWNFTDVWAICDGTSLPHLRWQGIECDVHIPVEEIEIGTAAVRANEALSLSAVVKPYNATNTQIVWSISTADDGSTGASIAGKIFTATAAGTATVTATIENGVADGVDYTQDFEITVNPPYQAVSAIVNVPRLYVLGETLSLTATVEPSNATFQIIAWSVVYAGNTGASISGDEFTASELSNNPVIIRATITDGTALGTAYTQDFSITVTDSDTPPTCEDLLAAANQRIDELESENTNLQNEIDELNLLILDLELQLEECLSIGTKNPSLSSSISLYPNPTSGMVHIQAGDARVERVEVLDINGRVLQSVNDTLLNVAHLSAGTYFVRIISDKGAITKKMIKE